MNVNNPINIIKHVKYLWLHLFCMQFEYERTELESKLVYLCISSDSC